MKREQKENMLVRFAIIASGSEIDMREGYDNEEISELMEDCGIDE